MSKSILCSFLFVLINSPIIGHERTNADFDKFVQIIRTSNVSKDWEALRKLAEEIKESWPESSYPYCKLVFEICSKLNSTTGRNKDQGYFLQSMALTTVEKRQGPVDLLVRISAFVQPDFDHREKGIRGEEWTETRRRTTRAVLGAYKRLDGELDRSFDPKNKPSLNLAPGGGYPAGVSPESIREPEIRKKYEDALDANAKKTLTFSQQLSLHEFEKEFLRNLEIDAVRAYAIDPINVEEIRGDFGEFGVPKELTARVVKQLESRMLAKIELDAKLAKLPPVKGILDTTPKTGLGADVRLRVKLSVNFKMPLVEDVLVLPGLQWVKK